MEPNEREEGTHLETIFLSLQQGPIVKPTGIFFLLDGIVQGILRELQLKSCMRPNEIFNKPMTPIWLRWFLN